jgi:adenylate cyclase
MLVSRLFTNMIRWESTEEAQSREETFEMRLSFAILRSERLRLIILIILAFGVVLQAFGTEYLIPKSSRPLRGFFQNFSLAKWGFIILGAMIYEIIALSFVQKALTTRRMPPKIVRFLSAMLEVSFPTMLMLTQGPNIHQLYAAHTPMILVYGIFITLSTLQLHFAISAMTGFVAAAGYFFVCWSTLPIHGTIVPMQENYFFVSPLLPLAKSGLIFGSGIVAGFVAIQLRKTLTGTLVAQEEKNNIIGMFGQYVSPSVVEKLMEEHLSIADDLTGEVRQVTVMFLDIRDFTAFAEKKSPQDVVRYLNTIFGKCIEIINENNGIVNKFLGDGFMAVFGAPFSGGSVSQDAINAVRAMQAILIRIEGLYTSGTIPETRVGIGLHSGEAVIGSVGSQERKEYTIIGDTVNLASRIEQLTKQFGISALMTDSVYQYLPEELRKEVSCSPLPPVQVKGRLESVRIFRAM